MSSVLWFAKNIAFRLYIGHAVAFVCLAAYGVIFYFIWLDGSYGRELRRKEIAYKKKLKEQGGNLVEEKNKKKITETLKDSPIKKSKSSKSKKKKSSKTSKKKD